MITASFILGTFAAALIGYETTPPATRVEMSGPQHAEVLRGTWVGNWGRSQAECTIEIDRIEGNTFHGTLTKERAQIRFQGTFDPATGALHFDEIAVLSLGDYGEWSLGRNKGFISPDGQFIAGVGTDEWGSYYWSASLP